MIYKGKTIWITGASSGIGKAMAIEISREKCRLILSGRDQEKLLETEDRCKKEGSQVQTIPFDLEDPISVQEAINSVISSNPMIDALFLIGGISQRALVKESSLEIDRRIMEVNFFSNVALSKAVLPLMLKNGGGQIAVASSIVGKFGFPYRSTYAASKHALHGFFESLMIEHIADQIKVSIILPGRVHTNISLKAMTAKGEEYGKLDDGQAHGMPVDAAAKKIISKLTAEKREIFVGGKELLMVHIKRFFPSLFFKIASKIKAT